MKSCFYFGCITYFIIERQTKIQYLSMNINFQKKKNVPYNILIAETCF